MGCRVMLDTLNITAMQRSIPASALGRAFGVLNTSAAVWLMAGSAIPPVIASLAGVQVAVLATAAVVAILGAASLMLREADPSGERAQVPAVAVYASESTPA